MRHGNSYQTEALDLSAILERIVRRMGARGRAGAVAEFRISSEDTGGLDLRRLAMALAESQGWHRDQVGIWDTRAGEVVVTIDDALVHRPAPDPLGEQAHTEQARHRACELVKRHPLVSASLRQVPFERLREEIRPFLLANWSSADILHALNYSRDGTPWPTGEEYHAEGVRWLQHRLRDWYRSGGGIRPSPSQEDAALRVLHRSGLPEGIGLPPEEAPPDRRPARPDAVRAAADDARRLIRLQARTTSNTLHHQDRTGERIRREQG